MSTSRVAIILIYCAAASGCTGLVRTPNSVTEQKGEVLRKESIDPSLVGTVVDDKKFPTLSKLARAYEATLILLLSSRTCCGCTQGTVAFARDRKQKVVVLYKGPESVAPTVRKAYSLPNTWPVLSVSALELEAMARPWAPSMLKVQGGKYAWVQKSEGELPK